MYLQILRVMELYVIYLCGPRQPIIRSLQTTILLPCPEGATNNKESSDDYIIAVPCGCNQFTQAPVSFKNTVIEYETQCREALSES